uniref:Uncharacterized protein n=1 Tax=Yersinia ruckeri TaxID=29486 RepID=A0A0A8V8Y6_YERRU|nr:hypothetical protein CSF007_1985 [Yersinia ruckeri]
MTFISALLGAGVAEKAEGSKVADKINVAILFIFIILIPI